MCGTIIISVITEDNVLLSKLLPTKIFNDIYEITPDYLIANGISALILDIDNTLVTYDDPTPTESVSAWLSSMHSAGIQTAFVSNNHAERVERFCRGLGCYFHADAKKPSRKYMRLAMSHMGTSADTTACVGDQLFTDVLAGKRTGIRAFLVPPIKDKRTLFIRAKRFLEKPFLRIYYRKSNKA